MDFAQQTRCKCNGKTKNNKGGKCGNWDRYKGAWCYTNWDDCPGNQYFDQVTKDINTTWSSLYLSIFFKGNN